MKMNLQDNVNKEYNDVFLKILSTCCRIIASSENQELIYHSQGVVHMAGILSKDSDKITVSSIKPDDRRLEIAAFAHEIERAMPNSLDPYNFQSFELYKHASTIRSSEILEKLMQNHGLDSEIIRQIVEIVFESSSSKSSNSNAVIVREADVLSFFKISLPNFFMKKISDRILQEICLNEFKKLTERGKKYLTKINCSDAQIKYYLESLLKNDLVS
jgi:hypothetical protein